MNIGDCQGCRRYRRQKRPVPDPKRLRNVDSVEFERTVRSYRDRVYGFAVHFLGDRREAEDVTQDVFLRMWKHRSSLEAQAVAGWLFRVARNACVDVYRRNRLQRVIESDDELALENAAAGTPQPDQWAERQHLERHLRESLDELREPYKSIVILREMQGLKYEEICEALDLPMSTVKVYLHRGRRTLREKLREVYDAQTA